MTDYFVRQASAMGGICGAAMWFDQSEHPTKSVEAGKKIKVCVAITDELKKEYDAYSADFQTTGAGFHRSEPAEHFPLDFFEWLQHKFPEPTEYASA